MITNCRTNKVLAEDEIICKSLWSKFRGLMFSRKKNLVFVFGRESIQSLHMVFVFFPIDVIFLDNNMNIVEIKEKFLPFTEYLPKHPAKYVLELSSGIVKKTATQIGDKIHISSL